MKSERCSINFCQNAGQCYTNSSNKNNDSWWCVCSPCIIGRTCELKNNILWTNPPSVMKLMIKESSLNYRLLFTFGISIMIITGLINNFLALLTFLNTKSIRSSYRGIYLVSYSICSIYVMIFIGIRYSFTLYGSQFVIKSYLYQYIFDCYIGITINAIVIAVCMWCSSFLSIERALLELFFYKLFGMTRKHAVIIILIVFVFCTCGRIATILTKMVVPDPHEDGLFKCGRHVDIKLLTDVELVFVWINSGGTCFLHFLSNVLTLISIARRKIYLSSHQLTWWTAWRTQIVQHCDYFIPPTVILLSQLGPLLFFEVGSRHACLEPKLNLWSHMHLFASFINYVPQTVTFLIFIYPSEIYMKDFYLNTFVGKWIFKLKQKCVCHTTNSTQL